MVESGREAGSQLRLVGASVERPTLSLVLSALAVAALVPAFGFLAPDSSWAPGELVLALAGIALIGYFGALILDRSPVLDATIAVALVAVVFLGPLPAACIWIGTELVARVFERNRPGPLLFTVASYGWASLAAAFVLNALVSGSPGAPTGLGAYLAAALAGVVMLAVNLLVAAPRLKSPALTAPRPVAELDHAAAVALYAQAIADELKLGSRTRLILKDAAQFMRERPLSPREGTLSDLGIGHRLALVEAVLYHREHWDCAGGTPGAIGGEMIPLTSRILAVADAWSGLTSKSSPALTHAQALNQLEARAGLHFDPVVVEAAMELVRAQRLGLPGDAAHQPQLQHFMFSELARRAIGYAGQLLSPAPAAGELTPFPSRRLS